MPDDRLSDPNWFPKPPPKPLQAPSAAKLIFGTLVPALAVVGAIFAMSSFGHSSHKPKAATGGPASIAVGAAGQSRREAFQECMKSLGAGPGFRGGGRFGGGGGPSKSYRQAFAVCRSLLQPDALPPSTPQRAGGAAAPAA